MDQSMNDVLYAEDVGHYWQTSRSGPDTWISKACTLIQKNDGYILLEAFGKDGNGRAAYMLQFELDDNMFRVSWPVLPSRSGKEQAARIQAATMLYRDVKARCMSAKVLGFRAAFFAYLMLPDGRTASTATDPELMNGIPKVLRLSRGEEEELYINEQNDDPYR